jgi:hypothetical protein
LKPYKAESARKFNSCSSASPIIHLLFFPSDFASKGLCATSRDCTCLIFFNKSCQLLGKYNNNFPKFGITLRQQSVLPVHFRIFFRDTFKPLLARLLACLILRQDTIRPFLAVLSVFDKRFSVQGDSLLWRFSVSSSSQTGEVKRTPLSCNSKAFSGKLSVSGEVMF